MEMKHLYRKAGPNQELCFNIESERPLTPDELSILRRLLSETFQPRWFGSKPHLGNTGVVKEIGPRLNIATAFSSNAVAILHACGLTCITRIEVSTRYLLEENEDESLFLAQHCDRMTEQLYPETLSSFSTGITPQVCYYIPVLEKGKEALREAAMQMGLSFDEAEEEFYYDRFARQLKRNPTNVELFKLGQVNSEHGRHGFFRGKIVIDDVEMPETLMEIIKSVLKANPDRSVIAFGDNSSGIDGYDIWTILPQYPNRSSRYERRAYHCYILFTAETHNHPTGVSPFPGAATGPGGRDRDGYSTRRGSLLIAGTAGYCTGSLRISGYEIPGEDLTLPYPENLASPLQILIEGSNGACDHHNKFGEPLIQGFMRTFDLEIQPEGERFSWIKPILFTGGVGMMNAAHGERKIPEQGMLIIEIGGPAYPIGLGGGSASSKVSGENRAELDFDSVQRADPEMGQRVYRVVRACVEMGDQNPILSIHDQGAGGPANVLTELVEPAGGKINIRKINLGDATMSVVQIWCAEYQERAGILIDPKHLEELLSICERENVPCEVLGEVSGDGKITVYDPQDNSTPVELDLAMFLTGLPQKVYTDWDNPYSLQPLTIPWDLTVEKALEMIFRLPSVGSKGFLVHKGDRSVTGLVCQQQCCGPMQLPVSDFAAVALSYLGLEGAVISIGEQPIKMMVNVDAGMRMSIMEMMTNIAGALIPHIKHIKCSVNWMWAAKLLREGARIYKAMLSLHNFMIALGIAPDGGKDSLSMAAKVGGKMVKAPGQCVISGYAPMDNITVKVTPDIKRPGASRLMLIDLSGGFNRMGGSALAQALGQIGDECPDIDPGMAKSGFLAVQRLIQEGLLLALHDRNGDGALITALAEMAMSGNGGVMVQLDEKCEAIPMLFAEEAGWVIEYDLANESRISEVLESFGIPHLFVGLTCEDLRFTIYQGVNEKLLDIDLLTLRQWWESTSDKLEEEKTQGNPETAKEQRANYSLAAPSCHLTFIPSPTSELIMQSAGKFKVAIIREEGSNGDREMAAAFYEAGFEVHDVTMRDLEKADITFLDQFRGIAFVGGFSFADALDSAKGWAGKIWFNKRLRKMFLRFYNRKDTFSLGVCNGCQLMALLGWVPWRGIAPTKQPRFIRNDSRKFESRWVTVAVNKSPSIMLGPMAGSRLGIWVAHGEGKLVCPDIRILEHVREMKLAPLSFVDDRNKPTERYPFNPNGSPFGITALCSSDGRHLALMPHPERLFKLWQWPYVPPGLEQLESSPWLSMFQNSRSWCEQN